MQHNDRIQSKENIRNQITLGHRHYQLVCGLTQNLFVNEIREEEVVLTTFLHSKTIHCRCLY